MDRVTRGQVFHQYGGRLNAGRTKEPSFGRIYDISLAMGVLLVARTSDLEERWPWRRIGDGAVLRGWVVNCNAPDGREKASIPWDSGRAQQALANLALVAFDGAEIPDLMGEAAEVACAVLGAEFAAVMEKSADQSELILRAGRGFADGEVGVRTVPGNVDPSLGRLNMPAFVMLSTDPIRTIDAREDTRFGPCPLMRDHGMVSGAMVKIYVQGKPFGVLGVHSPGRREFTPKEASWLGDVAKVLGGALARARENGKNGHRDHRVLRDAMEIIAASSGGRAALEATARVAVRDLADWCFIDVIQEDSRLGFTEGDKITRMAVGAPLNARRDSKIATYFSHEYALDPTAPHGTPKVLREGRPELIPVVQDETLHTVALDAEQVENFMDLMPTSYLAVPLRTMGRVAGTLVLVSTDPARTLDDVHLSAAEDLASCAALVLSGAHNPRENQTEGRAPGQRLSRPAPGDYLERLAREGEPAIVARGDGLDSPASAIGLTKRRLEILQLLSEHHTPKTIAKRLVISEKTVRTHVEKINRQLGVNSYREAVLKARSLGIVT